MQFYYTKGIRNVFDGTKTQIYLRRKYYMKRRKLWALALTAAMVGSLTACGGGSKPAETAAAPAETAAPADTKAADGAAADTQASGGGRKPCLLVHVGGHRAPGQSYQGSRWPVLPGP